MYGAFIFGVMRRVIKPIISTARAFDGTMLYSRGGGEEKYIGIVEFSSGDESTYTREHTHRHARKRTLPRHHPPSPVARYGRNRPDAVDS